MKILLMTKSSDFNW